MLLTFLVGAAGADLMPSRSRKIMFIGIDATTNDSLGAAGSMVVHVRGHVVSVPRILRIRHITNCNLLTKRNGSFNVLVLGLGP